MFQVFVLALLSPHIIHTIDYDFFIFYSLQSNFARLQDFLQDVANCGLFKIMVFVEWCLISATLQNLETIIAILQGIAFNERSD